MSNETKYTLAFNILTNCKTIRIIKDILVITILLLWNFVKTTFKIKLKKKKDGFKQWTIRLKTTQKLHYHILLNKF